jgi:hypothetical protein
LKKSNLAERHARRDTARAALIAGSGDQRTEIEKIQDAIDGIAAGVNFEPCEIKRKGIEVPSGKAIEVNINSIILRAYNKGQFRFRAEKVLR